MFFKKIPLLILFLLISIVSTSQASSVSLNFTGKECSISHQNIDSGDIIIMFPWFLTLENRELKKELLNLFQ